MATFSRVKTWVSNEILTAADLNAEFNNILTNFIPAGMESASASQALMQATTDPGAVGTESLASDLLGELKRLRYVIKRLVGAQWYTDPGRYLTAGGLNVQTADIASSAVTTAKIADANVTTAKIAAGAVTTTEIASSTIVAGNIANSTITGAKLVNATITGSKIDNGTIAETNLVASTITDTSVNDGGISIRKLNSSPKDSVSFSSGSTTSASYTTIATVSITLAQTLYTARKVLFTVNSTAGSGYFTIPSTGYTQIRIRRTSGAGGTVAEFEMGDASTSSHFPMLLMTTYQGGITSTNPETFVLEILSTSAGNTSAWTAGVFSAQVLV